VLTDYEEKNFFLDMMKISLLFEKVTDAVQVNCYSNSGYVLPCTRA